MPERFGCSCFVTTQSPWSESEEEKSKENQIDVYGFTFVVDDLLEQTVVDDRTDVLVRVVFDDMTVELDNVFSLDETAVLREGERMIEGADFVVEQEQLRQELHRTGNDFSCPII